MKVNVKMKDLTNDNEWLWNKNKFINRKFIMQEMYQNFVDGDTDWDVEKVKSTCFSSLYGISMRSPLALLCCFYRTWTNLHENGFFSKIMLIS